jgi:hypothetical protein
MFRRIANRFYAGSMPAFQRATYKPLKRKAKRSVQAISGGQFESNRRKH